jgi:hypothetical protein
MNPRVLNFIESIHRSKFNFHVIQQHLESSTRMKLANLYAARIPESYWEDNIKICDDIFSRFPVDDSCVIGLDLPYHDIGNSGISVLHFKTYKDAPEVHVTFNEFKSGRFRDYFYSHTIIESLYE